MGFYLSSKSSLHNISSRRVAQHVYSNYTSVVMLEWMMGALSAWLTMISVAMGYAYKNCECRARTVTDGRRESYRPPLDNL